MNRKGESNLESNVIYMVLFLLVAVPLLVFVSANNGGTAFWEDFYSKEISRAINVAEPGSKICLDVTKGSAEGFDNDVSESEMFRFDNVNNEIIVKFRQNGATAYSYFNGVDIVDWEIIQAVGGREINQLCFRVVERQR